MLETFKTSKRTKFRVFLPQSDIYDKIITQTIVVRTERLSVSYNYHKLQSIELLKAFY